MGKDIVRHGASHSFIAASCVRELGLEVETLEKPFYVSYILGTRVIFDLMCRDCELEISGDSSRCGPEGYGHVRVCCHPWDGLVDGTPSRH